MTDRIIIWFESSTTMEQTLQKQDENPSRILELFVIEKILLYIAFNQAIPALEIRR